MSVPASPAAREPAADAPADEGGPPLVSIATMDAAVAAILFAMGAVVVWQAWGLGASWTSDGPGAGYFPFYIGLILCIASAGNFVKAVRARPTSGGFVDREQLKRVLSVFVPSLVYVLAVVFLGLYVASAIYIAIFMVVLGKYPAWKSILVGVLVNAAFFAMFEVWFKVPLYKGTLAPLAFLGY